MNSTTYLRETLTISAAQTKNYRKFEKKVL